MEEVLSKAKHVFCRIVLDAGSLATFDPFYAGISARGSGEFVESGQHTILQDSKR
jgi:hypothetical protein